MSAKTTRILKEARALFWPWCAVTIVGAVPLFQHQPRYIVLGSNVTEISLISCCMGIALLATLSLGNEFQHRTLSLLLAQPVSRMEIWGEKMSVTIVAVLSAALVLCYGWRSALQQDPKLWLFAGAWIIAIVASATYWTLFARSTVGGLAVNISIHALIIEMPWFVLYHEKLVAVPISPSNITVSTITFVFLCYAGAMLWLGGRKLARFQVTGSMAGDDLLTAGRDVMPGALAGWFRSRPTGAVLNLIRKELRLLRPVWLISLLSALGWTWVTMLRLMPEHGFGRLILPHDRSDKAWTLSLFTVGPVAALTIAIAILAGSLSLGEEKTSGTHSWHMTLPVPARRQWLIKLFMALFAGVVCSVLLPILVLTACGLVSGSPFMFVDRQGVPAVLLMVLLLTFASFWCACAVNGTVRAVLWLFPVLGALVIAGQFGAWVGPELVHRVVSSFDFVTSFRFTNAVSNIQWPVIGATRTQVLTVLLVPTALFAVVQSYRLFRAQPQDSARSVVRNLAPLAMLVLLSSFSLGATYAFVSHAKFEMWILFFETHKAIEKILPGNVELAATHPLQLTVEDLAKASALSPRTRRWLRDSNITVAPDPAHSGYFATIHLASGWDCNLTVRHYGGRFVSFKGTSCVRRSP